MKGTIVRLTLAIAPALAAAGCAGVPERNYDSRNAELHAPSTAGARIEVPATPLECVPYARARSNVKLFGNAGEWWANANGRYTKSRKPLLGSVMVLTGYAGPGRGHLGVVSGLLSRREIRLDHANWLGNGAIILDDPVVDVSPDNDWTQVRVWNPVSRSWGVKTYLVAGFIGPSRIPQSERLATE